MAPFILLITGPAGAGKSSVSEVVAREIKNCTDVPIDTLKDLIVSDFIYSELPEGLKQWELVGENAAAIANNFVAKGYNTIINGYLHNVALKKLLDRTEITHKILLIPDVNVAFSRNSNRNNKDKLDKQSITRHYRNYQDNKLYHDFRKIDSTKMSLEQTVNEVINTIRKNWGEL